MAKTFKSFEALGRALGGEQKDDLPSKEKVPEIKTSVTIKRKSKNEFQISFFVNDILFTPPAFDPEIEPKVKEYGKSFNIPKGTVRHFPLTKDEFISLVKKFEMKPRLNLESLKIEIPDDIKQAKEYDMELYMHEDGRYHLSDEQEEFYKEYIQKVLSEYREKGLVFDGKDWVQEYKEWYKNTPEYLNDIKELEEKNKHIQEKIDLLKENDLL